MNKFDYYFLAGIALWFAETAYFGWNQHAQSPMEHMLDTVCLAFVFYGVIGGVVASIKPTTNIRIITDAEVTQSPNPKSS
jgi:hypothetical protein